jgi:tripartite-type tricarboxylate transporter receptor subunit TctC
MRTGFRYLVLACALTVAPWGSPLAQPPGAPQAYPARALHWILPGAPGSSPDVAARIVGAPLAVALGQPVIVDNRPGATGTIALATVAKAAPDGYTFGMISMPQAAAPVLYPQLPYDTDRDFAPVVQLVWNSSLLVVRSGIPARSVKELIAAARANPGQFTFASVGNGSLPHIAGELFRLRAGIDIRHIPFKSAQPAIAALMGDQADMVVLGAVTVSAGIQSGKLRALATVSPSRLAGYPDVPTMAEAGFKGFEMRDWFAMTAPAGVPGNILDRMAAEVRKAIALPEVGARLAAIGMEPVLDSTPEQARALVRSELQHWATVVREAGIHAD